KYQQGKWEKVYKNQNKFSSNFDTLTTFSKYWDEKNKSFKDIAIAHYIYDEYKKLQEEIIQELDFRTTRFRKKLKYMYSYHTANKLLTKSTEFKCSEFNEDWIPVNQREILY